MKKRLFVIALIIVAATATFLSGCGNKDLIDTVYTYQKVMIELPGGSIITGEIDSWRDYEGEQIQISIGGTTYLVHAENIVLIHED